jgi:hypothetical protein
VKRAVFLAAVLVLAGCSRPALAPEAAARVIRESTLFREPGMIGVGSQEAPSDCKAKLADDAAWRALLKIGWIEVRNADDFERGSEGRATVKCLATLTGDGLRAGAILNTNTYHEWRVPAATRELVAVRSVTPPEDGISTVEFTYRWRLSTFGSQVLAPAPDAPGTAVLRLLDGHWQVADFTALAEFTPVRR